MRITRAHLDAKIETINRLTGAPAAAYTLQADQTYRANIGHYRISSYAPGDRHGRRYSLEQVVTQGGGVHTVIPTVCGGETFALCLDALIEGIRIGQVAR